MLTTFMKRLLFFKFLLSYLLIFMIPVLFLGLSGYQDLKTAMEQKAAERREDQLGKIQSSLDTKMVELSRVAADVSSNPDLTPYSIKQGFYRFYEAKPLLRYRVSNDFLEEVVLYLRNEAYLISSESTYPLSMFDHSVYQYEHWNHDQFKLDIATLNKPVFRPAESVKITNNRTERLATYTVPIPVNSPEPYGTLLFMIKESALLEYLQGTETESGSTFVFNGGGQIIASADQELTKDTGTLMEQVIANKIESGFIEVDGQSLQVTSRVSPLTGWTFVMAVPAKDIYKPVDAVKKRWLLYSAVIMVIGSIAIFFATHLNYNPIKKLAQLAETKQANVPLRQMNELELITATLDHMAQSNLIMDERIRKSRHAIIDHLLTRLMRGDFDTLESFNLQAREVGLSLSLPYVGVLILEAAHPKADWKESVISHIREASTPMAEAYGIEGLEASRLVILYACTGDQQSFMEWAEQLCNSIRRKLSVSLTAGIGNYYEQVGLVGKSYIEASGAVDYKLIKGQNQTIFFSEVMRDEAVLPIPHLTQETERLKHLIRYGDTEQVKAMICEIAAKIRDNGTTLFVTRCLCYDVINTFVKTFQEGRSGESAEESFYPRVYSLMQFESVEQLTGLLAEVAAHWSQSLQEERGTESDDELLPAIHLFLEAHGHSPSFSIQHLAEHLSKSAAHLSRYYKTRTGKTLMEQLDEIRMGRAKELLETSSLPVRDIVRSVGYYDSSSFIRKFKKSVGLTPGEYRKSKDR